MYLKYFNFDRIWQICISFAKLGKLGTNLLNFPGQLEFQKTQIGTTIAVI